MFTLPNNNNILTYMQRLKKYNAPGGTPNTPQVKQLSNESVPTTTSGTTYAPANLITNNKLSMWSPEELGLGKTYPADIRTIFNPTVNRKIAYQILANKIKDWATTHYSNMFPQPVNADVIKQRQETQAQQEQRTKQDYFKQQQDLAKQKEQQAWEEERAKEEAQWRADIARKKAEDPVNQFLQKVNQMSTAQPQAVDKKFQPLVNYLKDYVTQMRAAGFSDYEIAKKLINTKSITVPNKLPQDFGQTVWATGLKDELLQAAAQNPNAKLEDFVPSPNEYLNYKPGWIANTLPNYYQYMGSDTSPFFNPEGQFSKAKLENLRKALEEYIQNYRGQKIPVSTQTLEAGVAGLPMPVGQEYYQYYTNLQNQNADAEKQYNEMLNLKEKFPEITFEPTDTQQDIINKITAYSQMKQLQDNFEKDINNATNAVSKWREAANNGENLYGTVLDKDTNKELDAMEVVVKSIMQGKSFDEMSNWVRQNEIPIPITVLRGLYYLYGQQQ